MVFHYILILQKNTLRTSIFWRSITLIFEGMYRRAHSFLRCYERWTPIIQIRIKTDPLSLKEEIAYSVKNSYKNIFDIECGKSNLRVWFVLCSSWSVPASLCLSWEISFRISTSSHSVGDSCISWSCNTKLNLNFSKRKLELNFKGSENTTYEYWKFLNVSTMLRHYALKGPFINAIVLLNIKVFHWIVS